jgi:chromatin structure-remodeling complex subunit SFH1
LIDAQIEEAQNASLVNVLDPEVSEEDIEWTDERAVDDIRDGAYAEEMAIKQWKEADCRIILNVSFSERIYRSIADNQLDVQIYTHILRDRIEWDLSSPLPPTLFAKHYCTEIGLTGEAIPLVAHAIHEELLKHKRDCLELELFTHSHPDEQAKWEKSHGGPPRTTNRTGAKGLRGIWRDWWEREEFGPVLVELSMEEMEKREMERTREARRLMRGVTGKRRR